MSVTREVIMSLIDQASSSPDSEKRISTVTKLAEVSGLSRSALYRFYPEAILYMRAKKEGGGERIGSDDTLKIDLLKKKIKQLSVENRALARACAELIVEFSEQKANFLNEIEERELRISYLERKVRDGVGRAPRLIK